MAALTWAAATPAVNNSAPFETERATSAKIANESNERGAGGFSRIITNSPALERVLGMVRVVAPTDATVFINGETGTGKELIAEAIHNSSRRSKGQFVKVNCAAIPAGLLESEMFGHERGAFTGAIAQRIGRFEMANRGTVFLDEVGEIPLELQPKLLRVLQEREFERLGGSRTHQADVRIIAATNQDLWQMVQERKFRADLYYRLNVFPMTLPPLRERPEDVRVLVEHFVHKFAHVQGKSIVHVPDDVMEALERHAWPGNVRELQNVIERGVIMTTGSVLSRQTTAHLGRKTADAPVAANVEGERGSIRTLADAERAHITATLQETNWVVGGPRGAAAQLGLPRTTLIARMQRLGICSVIPGSRPEQSNSTKVESASGYRTMEAVASGA